MLRVPGVYISVIHNNKICHTDLKREFDLLNTCVIMKSSMNTNFNEFRLPAIEK